MFFASDNTSKKQFIKISEKQFKQKYEILQVLGTGAYGQVSKAKSKHNNFVAVKRFKSQAVQYFYVIIREISNLKKMDHPNVLKLYDCYIVDQHIYYMVTQYCQRGCLTQFMPSIQTEREKLIICQQIAEGLAHAHQQGIVHRDLKPENILIGQKNIAKIGDFGCSTRIQENEVLTSRVGSPAYMDDRVEKNQNYDNTADIYSLGMVYIYIFQGKGIYDECNSNFEIKRWKSEIYRDYENNIEVYIERLPFPIKGIVKNCLSPDYSIRYSAEKIAEIIAEKVNQQKGGSKNLISTEDQFQENIESQTNTFACNLIAMNKQFEFRYGCQRTREELFQLLIKNKQNLEKIGNIQKLKYVEADTKAQLTFIILLCYRYWLEQIFLILYGEQCQLGSKYRKIDHKSIQENVLDLAQRHIKGQKQRIQSAMIGCARRIQGTLHLMKQQKYLPDHFKEFVNAVSQGQHINFSKVTYKALLNNIKTFFGRRIKKEYEYNRGEDAHDPKLKIIENISDSFQ